MKQMTYTDNGIDSYFLRNTAGLSLAELLWGLAIPAIFESAFLQIFLKQIGASNKIVGLIPSIATTGIMLFSLISAWLTSHLVHKKRAVVITHLAASLPFLLFGIALPYLDSDRRVAVFIAAYMSFSLAMGILLPVWQNFCVKIFSPSNTLKANAITITVQTAAKLAGSIFIYDRIRKYSFSIESASLIFILVGILCFTGSFLFMIIHENPAESKEQHSFSTLTASFRGILENRNYLKFLAGNFESYATIAVLSFYANYAVEFNSIDKGVAAGLFVSFIYTAGIITNVMIGWFELFNIRTRYIIARVSALAGTVLLLFAHTLGVFLTVSFILGISRGINQSAYAPAVKLLSGVDDATDYFALSYILIFPVSFSLPLVSGVLLDTLSRFGSASYLAVFIMLGVIQLAGLVSTLATDFSGKR